MSEATAAILVTGSAGFIGSHVSQRLVAEGRRVVGVDNKDPFYPRALKEQNLAAVRAAASSSGGGFEFIEADICDTARLRDLMAQVRPEGVIHLAAKAGVRPSIADPTAYARVNVGGTASVLDAAAAAACSRVIIASSSSVYGNCRVPAGTPFGEGLDVSEPISPYAATKRACELIAYTHWRLTGMPTGCLRFFTVYGPRQRPDLAIRGFLAKVSRGEPIDMFGDGTSSRDYTFIDDIVTGVLAAYERVPSHGYRVWNLGGHEPVMLHDLVRLVSETVGREAIVNRKPMAPGDVERTFADLTRASAELGFHPTTRPPEGIARQWAWMREHGV
ncbi:MAG: GDP-mannose 4,6-dehydratase [Phycisphaeraceae bacterium]|nr:GDP-mannose 4,6-dehydratase [Phycisphaeraceae bacterium]